MPYLATRYQNIDHDQNLHVYRLNASGTALESVGGSLNRITSDSALEPDITTVGGVPYAAWSEKDASNKEIRVAHLNAAGNAWVRDVDTSSPINIDGATQDATAPSIADVNGVPWVAWQEVVGGGTQQSIYVRRLNGASWTVVGGTVDKVPTADAQTVSLTAIGGVPWISWAEQQGSSYQIRVARYDAGTDSWVRVGDASSPLNFNSNAIANETSLTGIDGVPFVAWHEAAATGAEIRVAHLNQAGTAWERLADAPSPINNESNRNAGAVSLANVGGIPYVAWREADAASVDQIRASRLEPEFQSQSVTPGSTTASASATWHTYGLRFPIGFDYGPSLESSTTPTLAAAGQENATVTQELSGLSPSSVYQVRSFATVPQGPRILAPNSTVFQTTAVTPPGGGPTGDTTAPETTITKSPDNKLNKSKAKYKFTSSEPNSTFVCKFDKAKAKPCEAGKAKFKHLDDGKHKFSVYAVDAAGNTDSSPAKDKFKVV